MRTVEDEAGRRYLLVTAASDASRVRDPATGEERYLENDRLRVVGGASPLETAAAGVAPSVRAVLGAVHDDRALGLLIELVRTGPVGVRTLLERYDLCESDLHGLLGEFAAAGLLEETSIGGERGYAPTPAAREAVDALQSAGTD